MNTFYHTIDQGIVHIGKFQVVSSMQGQPGVSVAFSGDKLQLNSVTWDPVSSTKGIQHPFILMTTLVHSPIKADFSCIVGSSSWVTAPTARPSAVGEI